MRNAVLTLFLQFKVKYKFKPQCQSRNRPKYSIYATLVICVSISTIFFVNPSCFQGAELIIDILTTKHETDKVAIPNKADMATTRKGGGAGAGSQLLN